MSGNGLTGKEGLTTRAVHAGEAPDPLTGAHGVPIYQNTTFALGTYDNFKAFWAGEEIVYGYSRDYNPTVRHLEEKMMALEGAEDCCALASGMAAISTTLLAIGGGGHIIVANEVYNTANKLIKDDLPVHGMRITRVDITDFAAIEAAIEPDTKFIYTEVVSNPTLIVADIPALAMLAKKHHLLLIIDNTFLSPAIFRPLEYGADLVIHSATKFLAGHGEVLGGVVSGRKELIDPIRTKSLRLGGTLSAFGAWLILTGIRTLTLRVERHNRNAMTVARYLSTHPAVAELRYPGLQSDPGHATAARMYGEEDGYGGMVSLRLHGGEAAMAFFSENLQLITFATSLGDTASLAWPIFPTDVVRLSIGIEDEADIIADLERTLVKVREAGFSA
ncbi:MAG: trans-sulfuration enzyme family protein [Thermomicrobiales bacterium]